MLVFQQLCSNLLARMLSKFNCGRSCHFLLRSLYHNDLVSILSFRRHCVVVLFNHLLVLSRSCSFHDCPFNRSVVPSFQVLSSYQVLPTFSTGVLSEIFLTPCPILLIVSEAVCCDFIKYLLILSSSYSILLLFIRSAARICSSLLLFPTGVFSTFFFFVVFFL